jgi:hypothetical protein
MLGGHAHGIAMDSKGAKIGTRTAFPFRARQQLTPTRVTTHDAPVSQNGNKRLKASQVYQGRVIREMNH